MMRHGTMMRVRNMGAVGLMALAVFAVAGCSPQTISATPTEAPKQIKLTYATVSWQVHFAPDSAKLSADQQQALADFLAGVRVGYSDQVTVATAAHSVYGSDASLAALRQASIDAVLKSLRMPISQMETPLRTAAQSADAADTDVAVVKIGRYIVTAPNCPDYSKPMAGDFSNTPSSNFGCADMVDLGMMVADPADLVRGAKMGGADGDYATRSVTKYHDGTIDTSVSFAGSVGG